MILAPLPVLPYPVRCVGNGPSEAKRSWLWRAVARAAMVAALPCLAFLAPAANARDLKPVQTFGGSMPLDVPPLVKSPIASRADLERAWTMCRVAVPLPAIDFRRRMVLAAVGQSSKVSFVRLTLEGGNLKTNVAIAPDMPAYRTCTFVVVERAGVASVNGVALGK